jgi:hypothetical protein
MKKLNIVLSIIISLILFTDCCNKHQQAITSSANQNKSSAGPPVIIYKTKADYTKFVPIILSEDKKTVVSFPGVKDLTYKGEFAYPTLLNGDYLLDNRGISRNVAFLNLTYEQYSKLETTPTPDKLMQMLLDRDPLTEMYYCGSRFDYQNLIPALNALLEKNDFSKFRKEK